MSISWLQQIIEKSALELELQRQTIFRFAAKVRETLEEKPIQPWELDHWARGLKIGLLRMHGPFFRAGAGKRGSLSFFVRNDQNLAVGLRRESITQAATYVSLVTDYGYPRESTRFETGWMDVAVFDEKGRALIYAENKAGEKTLKKLCLRLTNDFAEQVPFDEDPKSRVDDALMKAQHIWRHRPRYFWAVSPTLRKAYEVRLNTRGFQLEEIGNVPNKLEWSLESSVDESGIKLQELR